MKENTKLSTLKLKILKLYNNNVAGIYYNCRDVFGGVGCGGGSSGFGDSWDFDDIVYKRRQQQLHTVGHL